MMSHSALYNMDIGMCHTTISRHKVQFRGSGSSRLLISHLIDRNKLLFVKSEKAQFLLNIPLKAKGSFFSFVA